MAPDTASATDQALHQLQSEQSKILDKIDELRAIGVGGIVELPQLIVCGNQSSGKSSVLEAISRVRFPAKSNVCTRFATEVILRRQPSTSIKVTIEPGPSRTNPDEKQKLRAFAPEAFSNGDDLPSLIEKAKQCMGVTETVNSGFSDDVLKVEISGPDKPELTLVDLPGLYYSTSQEQGRQGISIVRGITERYMKNTRSIILAVISAKTDYHLQEVLDIAKKFDVNGERTLGIITQPDILEARSEEEDNYLQFIKNEKVPLQLGWHALRNRSFETKDVSDDARDEKETEFFNTGRWLSIPRENVGIDSLRRRLSTVLFKHIRRNLPGLVTEIQQKITDRQIRLKKLGSARSNLQQQKGFLLGISSRFERIVGQALNGMYADVFFDAQRKDTIGHDFRRLRAVIRELNECFAEAMSLRGCRRTIVEKNGLALSQSEIDVIRTKPYMSDWVYQHVDHATLELEINEQARRNRGIELPGSANQLLVGNLFRDQAKPWEQVARDHMIAAWESARYFVHVLLKHLANEHTYSLLVASVVEPELEKIKESLLEKLSELTAYTKRGHPLPVGKSFLIKMQQARAIRHFNALQQNLLQFDESESDPGQTVFTLYELKRAAVDLESANNQFAAGEIIDQMQTYYDTALVTFVDNVAILGIENCLLTPLETIFTSQTINNMSDETVQDLAGEPFYIIGERQRLSSELDKLQAGLRTLSLFSMQVPPLSGSTPLTPKPPFISLSFNATSVNNENGAPFSSVKPTTASPNKTPVVSVLSNNSGSFAPTNETNVNPPIEGSNPLSALRNSSSTSSTAPTALLGSSAFSNFTVKGSETSKPGGGSKPLFTPVSGSSATSTAPFISSLLASAASTNPVTSQPGGLFGTGEKGISGISASINSTGDTRSIFNPPSTKGNLGPYFREKASSGFREYDHYQHITCAKRFSKYSAEELRLGDYERGDKIVG